MHLAQTLTVVPSHTLQPGDWYLLAGKWRLLQHTDLIAVLPDSVIVRSFTDRT